MKPKLQQLVEAHIEGFEENRTSGRSEYKDISLLVEVLQQSTTDEVQVFMKHSFQWTDEQYEIAAARIDAITGNLNISIGKLNDILHDI